MRKLDRHVRTTVLGAMLLVLLVLGGLDLLFAIVDEMGGTNELYSSTDALAYVMLSFPRHLYELLPMSAMIGALAGLGMLASHNELTVMQASGVSRGRIVIAVMKPTVAVMVLGLVLGELVAPPLELQAEVNKSVAQGNEVGISRFGHWERDGSGFIHFNTLDPQGVLYGINILVFDDNHQIVRNVQAERAVYKGSDSTNGSFRQAGQITSQVLQTDSEMTTDFNWLLEDGSETFFVRNGSDVESEERNFRSQGWQLDLSPDLLQVLLISPDSMPMSDLYRYAYRFERQGQDAAPYFLAFWKKATQPISTAVLVLLAVSFIFGPLREATMGSRVFTAICFGLAFTILQQLMHNISLVYQLPPLSAVLAPLLLCSLLGIMLFRRAA